MLIRIFELLFKLLLKCVQNMWGFFKVTISKICLHGISLWGQGFRGLFSLPFSRPIDASTCSKHWKYGTRRIKSKLRLVIETSDIKDRAFPSTKMYYSKTMTTV